MIRNKSQSGMSLIEVVIASAVVLMLAIVLISVNSTYLRTATNNVKTVKATYLIEEGIEVVNFLKDSDWANLGTVSTDYYLTWNGAVWMATTTPNLIDQIYTRKFVTEAVNRDASDNIVSVGGTDDPDTRKLTVEVSWFGADGTTTKAISSYIMNNND